MAVKKKDKKEKIPEQKKKSAVKSLWNNYIKRLNKITNGKPQCCK